MINRGLALLSLLLLGYSTVSMAEITSVQIGASIVKHKLNYSHFEIIGTCVWQIPYPPYVATTLELDEYQPDFIVSVYNQPGNNPWLEARMLVDTVGSTIGSELIEVATGIKQGEGNASMQMPSMNYATLRRKIVNVIGNPFATLPTPLPHLTSNVLPLLPYYQSEIDVLGRLGQTEWIESVNLLSQGINPLSTYIGTGMMSHWSIEFPRSMSVDVVNPYKAALITAQRGTDIVTNKNALHTVISTSNSCGQGCSVDSIKENTGAKLDKTERDFDSKQFMRRATRPATLWQELYPHDKAVEIGEDDTLTIDSLGNKDEIAGEGNYVFVVWRHYRGCVQTNGKLITQTITVPKTIKR